MGSTCTLVFELYKYHAIQPTPYIALLLASGILSDTAMLNSPTTTFADYDVLHELSAIADIDYTQYVHILMASTESLKSFDPDYAVSNNCKIYQEYGISVAVSQVEVIMLDDIHIVKDSFFNALMHIACIKNIHWAFLLITDIISQNSILISTPFAGESKLSYSQVKPHIYNLPGILLCKKQLLPKIIRILEELSAK